MGLNLEVQPGHGHHHHHHHHQQQQQQHCFQVGLQVALLHHVSTTNPSTKGLISIQQLKWMEHKIQNRKNTSTFSENTRLYGRRQRWESSWKQQLLLISINLKPLKAAIQLPNKNWYLSYRFRVGWTTLLLKNRGAPPLAIPLLLAYPHSLCHHHFLPCASSWRRSNGLWINSCFWVP